MSIIVAFWAAGLVVGALALPLSFRLFRRFPDGGAGLAFALGMPLTGWAYFTLRTFDMLPAGRGSAVLAVALLGVASAAAAGRDRHFTSTLRYAWPGVAAIAGVFTLFFFVFVAFRSYSPEIGGTEQPMDLMYLNASTESSEYPPGDPWLSGERASYYYFGYVQMGILSDVAGVSAGEGYNLSLAFTFAAAAAGVCSLGFALARWALGRRARNWAFGAAGAAVVLLLFVGSLAGVLELAAANGWGGNGLYEAAGVEWMTPCESNPNESCRRESDKWYPTRFFFWFDDTRVIRSTPSDSDTITEFPVFSFILGDLHPHVMSIPLVLLVTALAAATWRGRGRLDLGAHRRQPWAGALVALLLGALAFQNAWDLLTFSGLVAVAVLVRNLRVLPLRDAALATASYLGPIAMLAVVAYLPWYLDFNSQAEGLYPYVGRGSAPAQAFLQFGPLFVCGLIASAIALRRGDERGITNAALYTAWLPLGPLLLWIVLAQYHGQLGDAFDARGSGGWITLTAYGLAVWWLTTVFAVAAREHRPVAPVVGLAAVGTVLFFGAELFLIKDVFFGGAPRLNTVFKLTYQAWILLAVAGAVGLAGAGADLKRRRATGWLAVPGAALVALGLVYVIIAVPNRTEGLSGETEIDGLASLARADPSEYALTQWVRANVRADEVVLEATGRRWGPGADGMPAIVDGNVDYGDGGRISARTGRATPIGWYFHEIQWRGDSDANQQDFRRRQDLVDRAYISPDPESVMTVMRDFGARYLVLGAVEQRQYGTFLPDYESFLELVFTAGEYRVYRLHETRAVSTS